MNERSFKKELTSQSNKRRELLDDTIKEMDEYSQKLIKNEQSIHKSKIDEIKYKTTIKELNDYIKIYQNQIEELKKDNLKNEKEVMMLRKKVLKNETDLSSLKSILEIFIKEYGIDKVSAITKLESEKISKFIEKGE